jgi:hypothetical protein
MGAIAASCTGQNIAADKVPSVILNTLKASFANATDVEWEKHQKIYEAEFDINDTTDVSVRIDEAGRIVMQKKEMPVTEVPSSILNALTKAYPDYMLDDASRIEQNGAIYYQVELDGKNKKDLHLVWNENGIEEKNVKYWD